MDGNEITNGIATGLEVRKQRGLEIAALARIDRKPGKKIYLVPSQTSPRPTKYAVTFSGESSTCTCPDFETRACKCKHIWAVEFTMKRERHRNGTETITESVTVKQTRKTYPQDWPNYNAAQINEKRDFQILLHDLCKNLPALPVENRKGPQGRKPIRASDAIFSAVFKVYSTVSARRFASDLCDAQSKGYIKKVPHFNSILNVLDNPALFDVLTNLIIRASIPLKSVEADFAVDSTGFAYSRFERWFDIKYNKFSHVQHWVKAHICTGVKTNVITSIEIHDKDTSDCPQLPSLIESTAKNFDVKEVSADKGYSSRENHDAIANIGAVPYIAFKDNATGRVGGLYGKMFHYFQFQRDEFLARYHKRSNVESTVNMVKSKFGDSVRSKTDIAAKNEVLAKILCHNICCLISAMYELGLEPTFR